MILVILISTSFTAKATELKVTAGDASISKILIKLKGSDLILNLLVKLKKYFNGIGMVKRTLIMTVFALVILINFSTVLTHAEVLKFSNTDADLNGTKTSITRDIGARKITFSGGVADGTGGLKCKTYDGTNFGLYAYDGIRNSGAAKLTISAEDGYIFDIDSFQAQTGGVGVIIDLTYADDSTTSFDVGVSSSGLSTLSPTIKNVKKVVLSSPYIAIFQDFNIVNVRRICIPTVYAWDTSNITATTATLSAKVHDTGADDTTVYFNYGTTRSYGTKSSNFTVASGADADTIVYINISGLSPNTDYYQQIVARNAAGARTVDSISFKTLPAAPGAPTIGTVTEGDSQATVSFAAPASNGGAEITEYKVTSSPGGFTGTGTTSPITVSGLTNGTAYTFTVTAKNSAGEGSASEVSNSITPKTSQTITFANPGAQNFGTTPTLTATASSTLPVTFTSDTPSVATVTIDGKLTFLTAGTATIKVDQAGDGTHLAAPTVTQSFLVNAVVPGAPTIETVTAGNTQAEVNFTAPASNGGAAITVYTVTAAPKTGTSSAITATGTSSAITVTGLTNGTAYTFTVTAANSAGTGAASGASNSVTPKVSQTITFNNPGAQNFGTTPTLNATASSTLPVTFTSADTKVATITPEGALTFVAAGTAKINADQAGNDACLAAPTVQQTFEVKAVAPGAPAIGTVTAGDTQATVNFTAPSFTGGASITEYTVTAVPKAAGGSSITVAGTASPITVTGLTNGEAYTFTVTAANLAGPGTASAASAEVTPVVAVIDHITAANGTVSIELDKIPAVEPTTGDFIATSKINSGTASAITLTNFAWNAGTKTVTYNFTPIAKTAASQSVVVGVSYKGATPLEASAFTVDAAPYTPPYVPPYNPPAPTPQPTTETREVPVVVDNGGTNTNAVQVPVTRTTDSSGTKTDTVKFDEDKAKQTVTKALETKTDTATISVTDIPGNNADKVEVQVPQSSMTELGSNNIGLDVKTEKAALELPKETVSGLKDKDAKIEISEVKDSSEVEETKGLILKLASGSEVIEAPLKIETNFTGRTKITLPMDASKLPTSKEELDKFLSSLAVIVQHSDGENVIDKGTVVYDESGKPIGISIWVDKFSDFTLVSLPESYFQGRTTVIKDKVAADKEWNIKFTKIADSSTITKDNVYVTDLNGKRVEVEVSYGSDNILKITPVNPYKSGETYYLYISKSVKSKNKTSLINELRYQFTIK